MPERGRCKQYTTQKQQTRTEEHRGPLTEKEVRLILPFTEAEVPVPQFNEKDTYHFQTRSFVQCRALIAGYGRCSCYRHCSGENRRRCMRHHRWQTLQTVRCQTGQACTCQRNCMRGCTRSRNGSQAVFVPSNRQASEDKWFWSAYDEYAQTSEKKPEDRTYEAYGKHFGPVQK